MDSCSLPQYSVVRPLAGNPSPNRCCHWHPAPPRQGRRRRSEEHTSELQSRQYLVCRLLLEKKKKKIYFFFFYFFFFFFNDTATTEIYTLSLHDALPISEPLLPLASCTATARAPP